MEKENESNGPCYQFYHHEEATKSFNVQTDTEWAERMLSLPELSSTRIVQSTTWQSSMDIIYVKRNPNDTYNRLRHVFEPKSRPIYHTHHRFEVFTCEQEGEVVPFYLSFEKNGSGIIVQYSVQHENVVYKFKADGRFKPADVKVVEGTDHTKPLNIMMHVVNIAIEDILNNWKTVLKYSLLKSNCQALVLDIKEIINDVSEGVKFKFPGSCDLVSLSNSNRKSIISLLDTYYGNCFESDLTTIPERFIPKVLVSVSDTQYKIQSEEGKEYYEKELKDKLDVYIMDVLNRHSKSIQTGVVYFNNLNKRKMADKLNEVLTGKSDETNAKLSGKKCQEITEFWSSVLDGVIISQEFGVIIIETIIDQDETEMDIPMVEKKEMLIKELACIGLNKQKEEVPSVPVTTITVKVVEELDCSCNLLTENLICVKKSSIDDIDSIKEEFDGVFKMVLERIKKNVGKLKNDKIRMKQMKFLTGCLIILQNMEDADTLLFDRVSNQHWIQRDDGYSTRIVWSRQQKPAIDSLHFAMNSDTRLPGSHCQSLCQFVTGCPGSGKTFILLHALRYFCEQWPTSKALYIAPGEHTVLFQQMESKLKDLIDDGRVKFCTELSSKTSLDEIGFIAFDEFCLNDLYEPEITNTMRTAMKSGIHLISVSMELDIDHRNVNHAFNDYPFEIHDLKGSNYRSDKAIVELVKVVQETQGGVVVDVDPLLSSNMSLSTKVKHFKYMTKDGWLDTYESTENNGDNSLERSAFLDACFDYILSLKSHFYCPVLIYNMCHPSLLERIRQNIEGESRKHNGRIAESQFANMHFKDARACQGGEYATSIGIYDHVSVPYKLGDAIVTVLTRTILSAHLLLNIAETVPLYNTSGEPCIIYEESDDRSLVNIISTLDLKKENPYVLISGHVIIDKTQLPSSFNVQTANTMRNEGEVNMMSNWNMADVIIGHVDFFASYSFSSSSVHSCNSIFIVTGDCKLNMKQCGRTEETRTKEEHQAASRDILVNAFRESKVTK